MAAAVAAAVSLSVLAGLLSDGAWPWVVATYLRWPQVVAITAATVALAITGWWRSAVPAAIVTAALAGTVAAPLGALETVPAAERATLRVAVFNTGARNTDVAEVAEAVAAARADVAVMLESEDIAGPLDRRLDGLSRLPTPIDGPMMSAPVVLARRDWPVEVVPLGDGVRPVAVVSAEIGGRPIDIVAFHPLPPVTRDWTRRHDLAMRRVIEVLPREDPSVLACDCNAAPWTPSMERLLDAGLRGPSVVPTFVAPLIGLPIDHVLLGDRVAAVSRELGPFAGSDHRLIVTEVILDG